MRFGIPRVFSWFLLPVLATASAFGALQPPGPVIGPPTTPGVGGSPTPIPELGELGPEELSAIYEIGIGLADVQAFAVTRRLNALRAPGFALELPVPQKGSDYKQVFAADGKSTMDFKGTTPVAQESRWGGFLSGFATRLDLENDSSVHGYGIALYGVTLGIDYRVTDQLTLGVLMGYANSDVDWHRGGDISANIGTLGLYGSWADQGFYVNGLVTGSYGTYDTKRRGFGGSAHGDTDGFSFSGLLSTGYDFQKGPWTFGPFLDVQYTSVQFDGFHEHGSAFPLVIEDNRSDSLRTRLGARIARCFQIGHGHTAICPELALSWQHEYLDRSRPIDAHFASGSDRSFRVEGPTFGRDSLVVNAAITFVHNDRWSTYVAYDGVLARDDYEAHTVSGGVRVNF
jgi:outer membrane autotransporter protein